MSHSQRFCVLEHIARTKKPHFHTLHWCEVY